MKGGEIDSLRRKLQRALDRGDAERATELRARIKTVKKNLRVAVDESGSSASAPGGSSAEINEEFAAADDDSAKMMRKLARAENQGLEERAARLRQQIADAAVIAKLQRKLQRAADSGAGDERVRDLKARIAEAKGSMAAYKELPSSVELSKLHHKLARAESQGSEERAAQLKERIDVAEKNALLEELTRKFARARERGKGERASEIRARAEAAGLILPTDGDAAEQHEEMVDRQIWREHGAVELHPAPAVASAAASAVADVNGVAAAADDPHAGMVLAKNGKWYAKPTPPPPGNTSLLLFYAYVQPPWTSSGRAAAIEFTRGRLEELGCGGRLRVALEGFNGTLSGPSAGIRAFCEALAAYDPRHFGNIDFKIVDGLQDSKAFRSLKVWPVDALVNYGFDAESAPLALGGTHVSPQVWTELAAAPRTVMVDVRNANESAIGRFAPPPGGAELLDPHMRRSTEFGDWVDSNLSTLKGADKVLMYCTAGIRCERASALLAAKGVPQESIFQLEGGIHRYLDAFPQDGGIWVGKNYTFDKRFSHGAVQSVVVGKCANCRQPWERYQAQEKCSMCKMEVLICRDCERAKGKSAGRFLCQLCCEAKGNAAATARARAFAAAGGRDGEGEGRASAMFDEDASPRRGASGAGERFKRPKFN